MRLKIMLDAGHGYETPGKRTPDGMREYEFNRDVAAFCRNELAKYDVEVYYSHSDSKDIPLQLRTDRANNLKVDVFVSIHANAFGSGGWNDASGIETYAYITQPSKSTALAREIQSHLVASTQRRDRGVKFANFHVLRETDMPSVLIECGFMTNREEAALLRTRTYRQICGKAIAKALVAFYQLKSKEHTSLYKVQLGAFSNEENALQLANHLKKAGFAPYIYIESK
ncbi:N-acetylmuramoyl-L-alanine amidase [uncultured Rossellomorea sp.]|uniref:N-acetylmuramoyl-L-alanine amidase n=2 Tax=Rossellomorea sp. y25 TaxID=3118174 RepID=UPI0026322EA9|nr:N-acetylmuramoyl-L-alanine amidase [uncultured Rossellomorea sp.]